MRVKKVFFHFQKLKIRRRYTAILAHSGPNFIEIGLEMTFLAFLAFLANEREKIDYVRLLQVRHARMRNKLFLA